MNLEISAFLLDVHRASRHMSNAQFRPWLFAELQRHLRFDSGLWLRTVVGPNGPFNLDYHLDRQRPDRMSTYFEQELWREDPFMTSAFINGPYRAWAMSAAGVPQGRLRDYLELHQQRHVVCAFEFQVLTSSFAGFAMFRKGRDDPFNEDERLLVEFIEPHLRDAWNHNWLREVGATRPDRLSAGFAQAVCREDLALAAFEEPFLALLRQEWPQWQGPTLPDAWRPCVRDAFEPPWIGKAIAAYARRLRGPLWLVQLRAAHAFDLLPPRQREVARRFAAGAAQTSVASALRISPSTVNNYLVEIYRELGVNDKAELALLMARLEPARDEALSWPT
jgi:DNA-binding CsgD family transcriptional regulator